MSESDNRKPVTTYLDDDLHDEIESQLEYGDSKADWMRVAIRQRLDECDTDDQ